jgi:Protein of unknown function (DUF3999)
MMKRLGAFVFVAVIVLVVSVSAQTSLSSWPYYVDITPQGSSPGMYDVLVPLPVMDKARTDLADLRLFDSANREVPYAIRIRRDVAERRDIEARLFNAATAGPSAEVSVDLGENPGEHNEIEVETSGTNFRRQVAIEGSDSGTEWRTLNGNGTIFSFVSGNGSVASERVSYPTSRYRYLRVRVLRDPVTDDKAPVISKVEVSRAVTEKGLLSSWNVPVPSYQLLRNQGEFASAWVLDLGGRAPCDRLKLEIGEDSFSRPFQVFAIDDPDNVELIASGTLTRYTGDQGKPLVINFNQEVNVRKLRLQITDYSNPTLNISSIEASAPARQLVFELKEPPSQPLRLFFGNSTIAAPHYDFENELPMRLSTEPTGSSLGAVLANPDYRPEPKPFTERAPWLIYLVLAASSIALGYVLFSLARTATRMKVQQPD